MVESGYMFSQEEHDRKLGIPEHLCGQITEEAQVERYNAQVALGVPDDIARQSFGITNEMLQLAKSDVTREGEQ